jgi:hypothetical protein
MLLFLSFSLSHIYTSIAGIAFAGHRLVLKVVEVSTNRGTSWKDARIKDVLSQYT